MSFTTGFCSGGRLSAWRDTSVVAIPDLSLCWLVLKACLSACSSSAVRTLYYTAGKPTRTGIEGGVVPQRYLFGNYEDERPSPDLGRPDFSEASSFTFARWWRAAWHRQRCPRSANRYESLLGRGRSQCRGLGRAIVRVRRPRASMRTPHRAVRDATQGTPGCMLCPRCGGFRARGHDAECRGFEAEVFRPRRTCPDHRDCWRGRSALS